MEPNDFGLTTEEILEADDAELNRLVSLKKFNPYRWAHHSLEASTGLLGVPFCSPSLLRGLPHCRETRPFILYDKVEFGRRIGVYTCREDCVNR